jgi:hypothetical protein
VKNMTHLLMITDRSGSMTQVKDDAEGAINTFLKDQRELPGECELTFIQFDASNKDWYTVVYDGPIADAPDYKLTPRGGTALLDAIGKAVVELGWRFTAMPEDERPSNVIVVIQTDGQENSSVQWNQEKIKDLIRQQQEDYNWSFVFLGMGPDTWAAGVDYGIHNNIRAAGTGASYGSTYDILTANVTASRLTGDAITGVDEDTK